jgi:hypothetical protein
MRAKASFLSSINQNHPTLCLVSLNDGTARTSFSEVLSLPANLQTSSNSTGATGALMLGITLTNKSKNPCALTNPPQVTLLNGSREPLDVQVSDAPGKNAIASLVWRNACQPLPNDSLTMRLELSAGQNLDVVTQLLSEPRCDAKTEPSTLTVAPYSYPP